MYGSQCGMIEFSAIEIAIGKRTLNKSYPNKITSGKITINKLTGFKFFEVHFLFTISGVLVSQIKEVCCHNLRRIVIDWIAYPVKLRFEKTKNPKIISSKLDHFLTGLNIQQSSALKIQLKQKNAQASLAFFGFKPVTF